MRPVIIPQYGQSGPVCSVAICSIWVPTRNQRTLVCAIPDTKNVPKPTYATDTPTWTVLPWASQVLDLRRSQTNPLPMSLGRAVAEAIADGRVVAATVPTLSWTCWPFRS